MGHKILIVDDELKMRILIRDILKKEGYETFEASNGEDALNIFLNNKDDISLIILDVMMPKMDGWETCQQIRKYSDNVSIFMLTAKSENEDIIKGFKLGTDDYLTKPFHMQILIERVKALLKRTHQNNSYSIRDLIIDLDGRIVKYKNNNIDLSSKEYDLLLYLTENVNIALSREDILQKVWNYDYLGDGRTIDTHIKTLRNKLGDFGDNIKTVWGFGYKLEIED